LRDLRKSLGRATGYCRLTQCLAVAANDPAARRKGIGRVLLGWTAQRGIAE
jgi:hypothetical protein